MKKRIGIILLLVAFLLASSPAHAARDGNWLMEGRRAHKRITNRTGTPGDYATSLLRIGYISGVVDSFNGSLFTVPAGATVDQTVEIVGKYLEQNPQKWASAGWVLVVEALTEAFPVREK